MHLINTAAVEKHLDWSAVATAIYEGHLLPRPEIGDLFLRQDGNTLLSRGAWIKGLGIGLKSMSVFPENPNKDPAYPSIHGGMLLFDDTMGAVKAVLEGQMVTKWKTASDSALGAKLLARRDAKTYLIIGAGTVARNLVRAFSQVLPNLKQIIVYNRTFNKAEKLAKEFTGWSIPVTAVNDLPIAVGKADVISTATFSATPILMGEWVRPGTHVDLIGAFKSDMREADDALLQKSRIFVDSLATTLDHIGELMIPLASGTIDRNHVLGDFYDLCPDSGMGRKTADDITLFKNGGGAHLDLMVANVMYNIFQETYHKE